MSNIGISGIVLIVIMAIVVFGPKKLPEIGRSFGKSLKEFRDATSGNQSTTNHDHAQQSTQTFSSATTSSASSAEPHSEGTQSANTQL